LDAATTSRLPTFPFLDDEDEEAETFPDSADVGTWYKQKEFQCVGVRKQIMLCNNVVISRRNKIKSMLLAVDSNTYVMNR
jgi:hypothetical protein